MYILYTITLCVYIQYKLYILYSIVTVTIITRQNAEYEEPVVYV